MRNFLGILAAFVLAYILGLLFFVAIFAWMWLPLLMNHWSGFIIGVVICFSVEILYYKFLGDN